MTPTRLIIVTLIAASAGLFIAPQHADAGGRCQSQFSWGGQSYFGDRWVYSYWHAYPRHTYTSSRHFIYYRRVPHFYSSIDAPNETFYRSPWYDSYYRSGPYYDAWRYDRDRDRRHPLRLWQPYCPDDDGERYDRPYQPGDSQQPETRTQPQAQPQRVPNFERPAAQPQHAANTNDQRDSRELDRAGLDKLDRAWSLLSEDNASDALPLFAEAAMLRSTDAQPRLGYGLAAAATGQDMVASWAIRRALAADPHAMTNVPMNDGLRAALTSVLADDAAVEDGPADQARNRLVIAATLAVLLGDDDAMKQSLTRLMELNERDTVRTLAIAARHTLRARLEGDEPQDFPAEFMASRPGE